MDDEELVELKRAIEDARYARQKEMMWKAACAEQRAKTDESLSELARLRAALAEAERERDEALLNLSKQTEYAEILAEKAHNMEVQRDEALIDRKHLSAMLEMELKRGIRKERKLRRTIRALVVAARAMWWALRHMGGHQPFFIGLVRSEAALLNRMGVTSEWEILERQREAERGQAGKDADNG